jgi:hypothetical protein
VGRALFLFFYEWIVWSDRGQSVRQKDVSFFSIEQLQLHTLRRTMRTHCVLRTISLKCRIEVYVYSTNPSEIL